MDTFKIKAVIKAAEYKSLSKAAEEFSYTPSAFSHMMKSFEAELGMKIFNRYSTGVELTNEGKELYSHFIAIIKAEEGLLNEIKRISNSTDKCFRIAAYSSISRCLLSEVLKKFKAANPCVEIRVNIADDLTGWIENDKADLVIAEEIAFGNTKWYPLFDDKYYIIGSRNLIGDKENISLNEIYDFPYIYVDDTVSRRTFSKDKFKEFIYFKSEDDLSIIRMVEEGIGITMLPNLVIKGNTDKLKTVELTPEVKRTIGYAYKKQMKNSSVLKEIVNLLKLQSKILI